MGIGIGIKLIQMGGKATAAIVHKLLAPVNDKAEIADLIGYAEVSGDPASVVPDFIGQRLFDTTNNQFYIAYGVASGNWRQVVGFALDDSGNVTGLVGPNGDLIYRNQPPNYPGGVFCDWSAGYGTLAMVSTDTADDVAVDTSVLFKGSPTIKCTFSSDAATSYIARYTFTNPVSLAGVKTIQIPIRITSNENTAKEPTAAFQIWLKTATGQIRLHCTAAKVHPLGWHVFSFSEDITTYVTYSTATWATFDSNTVTGIDIVMTATTASNAEPIWVGPLSANAKTTGRVSIRMDGEYISQYTILKPLLDLHGFKASLSITTSLIDSALFNTMSLAQIDEFYQDGHECIHHTFDNSKNGGYVDATDWPASADITADIKAGWDFMYTQGWTRGIGIAVEAYVPAFISTTALVRQKLVLAGMRAGGMTCMVSSAPQSTFLNSLGTPMEKPFYVRGAIQITSTHTAADVMAIIDRAEELGEWAIITIHRAVASSPGSLEMTTENFQTWLAYLKTRVQAGGIICQPIGEVYNEFYGR